jgi:hypothetical protein
LGEETARLRSACTDISGRRVGALADEEEAAGAVDWAEAPLAMIMAVSAATELRADAVEADGFMSGRKKL